MSKSSMGCLRASVAATLALALAAPLHAQTAAGRFPVTPEQRSTADQVAQAGVPLSALAPTAPDRYTVKSGDTLWDLSSMYLTTPWRWPELWGMNREQIRNPHLIYPGQVLLLIKSDGRARLEVANAVGDGDAVRLQPRVRNVGDGSDAIPAVPNHLIEPFLSQPMVLPPGALDDAARLVATQEGRVYVGRGDQAYVRGLGDETSSNYNVFRPLRPLFDPDDTARRRPIAFEAFYLGTANVARRGEVATININSSKQEIGIGDRLLPIERASLPSYVPRLPSTAIDARVISVYGGVRFAGGGSIVTLNRGTEDGLEVGSVVQLMRSGATVRDRTSSSAREMIKLPDEPVGLAFVFRAFPTIAYALIVRGTDTVEVGDRATNPDGAVALSTSTRR